MVNEAGNVDTGYFLAPGMIDAHTHMGTEAQAESMLANGVTAICYVAASALLIQRSERLTIVSSAGMTMGTLNGKSYVKKQLKMARPISGSCLWNQPDVKVCTERDSCDTAREQEIKAAVHAVSLKAVRLAVDCGADNYGNLPAKCVCAPRRHF